VKWEGLIPSANAIFGSGIACTAGFCLLSELSQHAHARLMGDVASCHSAQPDEDGAKVQ